MERNAVKLPKGIDKLPTGVEIHHGRLRIWFLYRGVRCREPIKAPVTASSIKYAENKRRTIMTEIDENRFDYASHFPDSAKAAMFSGYGGSDIRRTVEQGITSWLAIQAARKAPSTYRNYRLKANHVLRKWGKRRLADLTKSDFELFQAELLNAGLAPKTVNDIFTIVRGVFGDAFHDGIIKMNPLERVRNIERDVGDDHADPFTREELERITKVKTRRQSDINMIMFACWSGLALSEMIGLAWEDVDTEAWTIRVRRARVDSEYKVPKERSRVRDVELVGPAIEWLRKQKEITLLRPATEIKVRQRDNVTFKTEEVRFVFLNAVSDSPWHASSVGRWFAGHLARAKVRHRGPNQCRHTFASQCLSAYVPKEWVARQLGHGDVTMINKHYGRWIPTDSRSMAGMVTQMLGFGAATVQADERVQ